MLHLKYIVATGVGALLCAMPLSAQPTSLLPAAIPQDQPERGTAEQYVQRHDLIQSRVMEEFTAWRYPGASLALSRLEGAVCSLVAWSADDPAKVWTFYVNQLPTENHLPWIKLPAAPQDADRVSWKVKFGAFYTLSSAALGVSYSIILPPPRDPGTPPLPRDRGTIVFQKGEETIYLEIQARAPKIVARTGIQTEITLIKLRPLNSPKNQTLKDIEFLGSALTNTKRW